MFQVMFPTNPPSGFEVRRPYTVLHVDVIDDETTRFLIADRSGVMTWVDMSQTRNYFQRPTPQNKTYQNKNYRVYNPPAAPTPNAH